MLIRLISSSSRVSLRNSFRNIRTTAVSLGGHHDHEPVPVYIPKPGSANQSFFGNKVEPISAPTPYSPGAEDYASFVGAGIGVLLTFLAVVTYTDVFKSSDDHGKSHSHAKPTTQVREEKEAKVHVEASTVIEQPEIIETAPVESVTVDSVAENNVSESPKEDELSRTDSPSEEVPTEKNEKAVEAESSNVAAEEIHNTSKNNDSKIPVYCEYLLIGSGAAAYYAAIAIRARDADAKVLMVGEESNLPYQKPPLSKELWWYGDENSNETLEYKALTGKTRDIFFEAPGFFVPPSELEKTVHGGVSLLSQRKVVKLNADAREAYLEDGTVVKFGKCLLATGSQPKKISELEKNEQIKSKVIYLRNINDYKHLEEKTKQAKSVTVVGGGFLGSELAYSIKRKNNHLQVNQVIAENGNLAKVLPDHLSHLATESVKQFGVNVLTQSKVIAAEVSNDKINLKLSGPTSDIQSDFVVVAIGVSPNVELAGASGLETDSKLGGLLADSELRVKSGVYCAGDNCSFFDKALGRRRLEHWEHAQISGRLAGENMTGGEKSFWYQPSFFTKFSPKYHISAVGVTSSELPTVSVFAKDEQDKEKYERGVVFYKGTNNQVIGVLLLNVFGPSIDVARRLIEDGRPVEDFRQLAKLFPLFDIPKDDETTI